jgi:membrane protein required for colicin V production
MIWADWFLLGALVISILIGVLRGFTREVLGLASWIVAVIAALVLAPSAGPYLESHVATPSLRIASSYALVFFAVLVLGAIVTGIVSMLVRKSPLSGVDRMVGAGFGLLRGVLVAVLLVWVVGLTPARQDPWWGQSAFIPRLEVLAGGLTRFMPELWRQRVAPVAGTVAKEGV